MNRRTAVKQLFIIAGGLVLWPSCQGKPHGASIALNHLDITDQQEVFLGHLVEGIIPETDSPGARALNLHLFVLKMVDDCHSPEDQQLFVATLSKMQQTYSETQIASLLEQEQQSDFLKLVKRRVIQGYLNSEYIMKNKLKYELIPGRYLGAVKLEA